jgi:hypothetical protein
MSAVAVVKKRQSRIVSLSYITQARGEEVNILKTFPGADAGSPNNSQKFVLWFKLFR